MIFKKLILFTTTSKITKYLRINLTKEPKDLYTKNYKYCWKKLKITQIDKGHTRSWMKD
jgi:hypothetical protein